MRTIRPLLVLSLLTVYYQGLAQHTFKAVIKDKGSKAALTGAVVMDRHGHGGVTNDSGRVVITDIDIPNDIFVFSYTGYESDSLAIKFPDNGWHEVLLAEDEHALEEVTIVSSTRTNERIENAPIKVEVLGKEEMDEENTIRPANIASILGDISGIQIQQSSAVSGNTNVRIQGLSGQYTQILRDGMPLYDGFSGGFGVLQIPPLDLRQVELIKGSASTLYGGGAIAGLINLISKRPSETQEAIFTLNATTLKEQDVNAYFAKRSKKIGYTFFAGYTRQGAVDVNGDGFSDVPDLNTFTIHPRLFYYPDEKTTITVGYNGTFEKRFGGDMQVIGDHPDSLHRYYEKNITGRHTGEFILDRSLPGLVKLTVKGSVSSFNREIASNINDIKGNQLSYYSEASVFIPQDKNSIVAGINATGDQFKKLPGSDSIVLNDFYNNTIGAFAQYTLHLFEQTTLEAGLRGDHTDQHGNFILPRIALFHRFDKTWAVRAGAGLGYKLPNPLEVQIIDYPIEELQPIPSDIKAETSAGYNLEGNFKKELGEDVNIFINHAFFLTQITNPVISTQLSDNRVFFSNADRPITTMGFDTYVKLVIKTLEIYLGYTYTDAERKYLQTNQFLPLTPRNRFAFTAVRKVAENWRVGLEGSYVGTEYRDGDKNTQAYFFTALMIERKIGKKFSIVLNGENLLDYRQTKYEQIYTGTLTNPTFKPLWAPIEGRVINLSLRIMPFNK
jgi:iron complex outermembrane receptor protein/outer membrane receptor for ferrienterochelin and colicins